MSSSGIQTLLEAEHKAQETVQEARAFRAQRLKAAKSDAAAEIAKYKATKESEFEATAVKSRRSDDEIEKTADDAARTQIDELLKKAETGRESVVDFLLNSAIST